MLRPAPPPKKKHNKHVSIIECHWCHDWKNKPTIVKNIWVWLIQNCFLHIILTPLAPRVKLAPWNKAKTWRFPTVLRCGSPLFRCPWMCVRAVTSAWSTSLWSNVRVAGQNGRKVLTGTSHWSCNLAASHQVQGQVRFVLRMDLDTSKTVGRRTNCKTVHYQNSKAVSLYLTLFEYRKSKRRRQATQLSSEDHVKKLMRFQHSSISMYWRKTIAQEVSIS